LGIQEFWTVAFSSEDVGYLKPNPEPFRELAARMGFSPPEILYVGNSYRYDVLGAAAEGFVTAHLGGSTKNSPAANVVVRSFPDLHRWILEHLDTAKI
jgi:putative hydrolase of the HAD superfamily